MSNKHERAYQQTKLLKEIAQVERLMESITQRLSRLQLLNSSMGDDAERAQGLMTSITSRLLALQIPTEEQVELGVATDVLPGE